MNLLCGIDDIIYTNADQDDTRNFHKVSIQHVDKIKILVMRLWCEGHPSDGAFYSQFTHDWDHFFVPTETATAAVMNGAFYFEREQDAMMFALIWT